MRCEILNIYSYSSRSIYLTFPQDENVQSTNTWILLRFSSASLLPLLPLDQRTWAKGRESSSATAAYRNKTETMPQFPVMSCIIYHLTSEQNWTLTTANCNSPRWLRYVYTYMIKGPKQNSGCLMIVNLVLWLWSDKCSCLKLTLLAPLFSEVLGKLWPADSLQICCNLAIPLRPYPISFLISNHRLFISNITIPFMKWFRFMSFSLCINTCFALT